VRDEHLAPPGSVDVADLVADPERDFAKRLVGVKHPPIRRIHVDQRLQPTDLGRIDLVENEMQPDLVALLTRAQQQQQPNTGVR